jgi:hypothetical protein
MLKDMTYKDKFKILDPWMPSIVDAVKKDLKQEHLKQDMQFAKKYFSNKNIQKLTIEELIEGYRSALSQESMGEALAEYISNRWLLKNSEIYHYFEEQLHKIDPQFNDLVEIEGDKAHALMEDAILQFGAPKTYLFSVINSVVFPQKIYDQLQQRAQESVTEEENNQKIAEEQHSLDMIHQSYQQQIARLTDKYEKKLLGLQKKYTVDVDGLKKQVSLLQRKLNGN